MFFLTYLINKYYRQVKIKFKDQVIMAYGGLRGGIGFSLMQIATMGAVAVHHGAGQKISTPHENVVAHRVSIDNSTAFHGKLSEAEARNEAQQILLCSTLLIVLFTCFIQGTTISYVIDWLSVERASDKKEKRSHFEESAREIIHEVMMGVRGIVSSHHGRQYYWFKFDKFKHNYLNPIFERNPNKLTYFDKKIGEGFEEIADKEKEGLMRSVEHAKAVRNFLGLQFLALTK